MIKEKISIVTPVYNCVEYIEDNIKSIKNQTYQNFEHIIVDGGSTDGTLDIIRKYDGSYPMRWISEKDKGMYDAINKGFKMADGRVFAWLNADDMYLPWTFEIINNVMSNNKEVQWCTGIPVCYTEKGILHGIPKIVPIYSRKLIAKGYYDGRILPFLQQESMFWSKELWEKVREVDSSYKLAADYWLWTKFARYEQLYTLNSVISGFRKRKGQQSGAIEEYYKEIPLDSIKSKFWNTTGLLNVVRLGMSIVKHKERYIKCADYL